MITLAYHHLVYVSRASHTYAPKAPHGPQPPWFIQQPGKKYYFSSYVFIPYVNTLFCTPGYVQIPPWYIATYVKKMINSESENSKYTKTPPLH